MVDITYHAVNLALWAEDREQMERELARVHALVGHFPQAGYAVSVEKSPRKGGVGISVGVRLPTGTLFATGWGGDIRSAVEVATDKVVRQARRHLEMLRQHERAGAETVRGTGPAAEHPPLADLDAVRDLEEFSDHVSAHAAHLDKVLRRERRLDPRTKKAGGRVSIPDIVEEALAYVFEHFREKPKDLSPDRWLVRRGLIILDRALDQAIEEAGEARGDDGETAEIEDARRIWEELLDLEFPAGLNPLDKRAADEATTAPDMLRDRREIQRATAEALQGLSDPLRRVVVLRHLEGYEPPEIAYVLNADEKQVSRWLEEAETLLRDRLRRYA